MRLVALYPFGSASAQTDATSLAKALADKPNYFMPGQDILLLADNAGEVVEPAVDEETRARVRSMLHPAPIHLPVAIMASWLDSKFVGIRFVTR